MLRLFAAVSAVAALAACGPAAPAAKGPAAAQAVAAPAAPAPMELRVTGINVRDSVGSEPFKEKASQGGVLIVVSYTVANTSDRPIPASEMPAVKLVDPAGNTYEPDMGKTIAYATEADLDMKAGSNLNPGITVRGGDVFEIGQGRFDPNTWSISIGGTVTPIGGPV